MYTHQVNYSKRFVSGPLAGRLYHDHIRFCSRKDAVAFALHSETEKVFKAAAGSWDYRIEDTGIIDLAKFA